MSELVQSVRRALQECLALQKGEKFLVITDKLRREIGQVFLEEADKLGAEAVLLEIIPTGTHGKEPPELAAKLWLETDVFAVPTSYSLTHTKARSNATKRGARGATLPGVTPEIITRALNVDYEEMEKLTLRITEILRLGSEVTLSTPAGTQLSFSIAGRVAEPDTGIYRTPGSFGNLPAGESYIAPMEETAEGILVIDGAMSGIGEVKEPIRIEIKAGKAVSFSGGEEAKKLEQIFLAAPELARSVAEFGVGTNPAARISGNVLEDEKVMGTVHIALGNNLHFGGKVDVPLHLDGIIKSPTFWVDTKLIMKEGKLAV